MRAMWGRWVGARWVGPRNTRMARKREVLVVLVRKRCGARAQRSGTRLGGVAGWPRSDTDDDGKDGLGIYLGMWVGIW